MNQNTDLILTSRDSQVQVESGANIISGSDNSEIVIGTSVCEDRFDAPWNGSNVIAGTTYYTAKVNDQWCILPVEFTQFSGKAFGKSVQLNWETAWERGADRFVVERSRDAKEFFPIGEPVKSAGDADNRNRYTFEDKTAFPGANYYRLRQVDRDGTTDYSKIISVVVNADQEALLAYQSAENGDIRVLLNAIEAKGMKLSNISGQTVSTQVIHLADTEWVIRPAAPLVPGVYLIAVDSETGVKRVKFFVQ